MIFFVGFLFFDYTPFHEVSSSNSSFPFINSLVRLISFFFFFFLSYFFRRVTKKIFPPCSNSSLGAVDFLSAARIGLFSPFMGLPYRAQFAPPPRLISRCPSTPPFAGRSPPSPPQTLTVRSFFLLLSPWSLPLQDCFHRPLLTKGHAFSSGKEFSPPLRTFPATPFFPPPDERPQTFRR